MIIPVAEVWCPVIGFAGYEVSDQGSVRSFRSPNGRGGLTQTPHTIKPVAQGNGKYLHVDLGRGDGTFKNARLHNLILEAFVGPRPSPLQDGCHNDGDSTNNKLNNLRWDTKQGNMKDKVLHGTLLQGEEHGNARLTEAQVAEIKAAIPNWQRGMGKSFADKSGVGTSTISRVKQNQNWSHV